MNAFSVNHVIKDYKTNNENYCKHPITCYSLNPATIKTSRKGTTVGFSFRKTKKLDKNTSMNVSKSGVSFTRKAGPVSINSKGQVTIRLGKGLTWRL